MEKQKILVYSAQYFPDKGPSAPIFTDLCEDLAASGFIIEVITCTPEKTGTLKNDKSCELRNGVIVNRIEYINQNKHSKLSRIFFHLKMNLAYTFTPRLISSPDIILSDSPFLWFGLPMLIDSGIKNIPYIYIVHDIYPDILTKLKIITNPTVINIIGIIEKYFYRKARFISVLTSDFKENLIGKGIPEKKIAIIPPCVDTEFIKPMPKAQNFVNSFGIENKFVVLYAGNIGLSQDFELIIEAAKQLIPHPEIVFLMIGDGAAKLTFEEKALRLKLSNIKFFPFVEREKISELYSIADISLITLKNEVINESLPSKTFSIMASGKPIIASVNLKSEVGRIISLSKGGMLISPEDPEALSNAIRTLQNDPINRKLLGKQGRSFVQKYYSREIALNKYLNIIQKIILTNQ